MPWCVICKSRLELPLHRFPDPERYHERYSAWVTAVGEKLKYRKPEFIIKNVRLCHKHFEKKFHNRYSRLNNVAVPTLHMKLNFHDDLITKDDEFFCVGAEEQIDDSVEKLDDFTNDRKISSTLLGEHDYSRLQDPGSEGRPQSKDVTLQDQLDSAITQSHNDAENLQTNVTALVLITVPEKEIGSEIGRALIERDLAACVEVIPGTQSIYKCQGKVREDNKVLLLAKTRSSIVTELCEYAAENYPMAGYQIVSVPIENGNPHYLKWIANSVPFN